MLDDRVVKYHAYRVKPNNNLPMIQLAVFTRGDGMFIGDFGMLVARWRSADGVGC